MDSSAWRTRGGFTLLELSIVLIVIGLVVGGILVGQEMIRSGELRSVLTDVDRLQGSVDTFQLKYSALPGDYSGATRLWGSAGGTGGYADATCLTAQTATAAATCNGNGNGTIGAALDNATTTEMAEWYLAFKHLADAQLTGGGFTGYGGASNAHSIPGQNVPISRIGTAGYTLMYGGPIANGVFGLFGGAYKHLIVFGGTDTTYETRQPVLTTGEAERLDAKADDGKPGSGKVQAYLPAQNPCATTSVASTAIYDMSRGATASCALVFGQGF